MLIGSKRFLRSYVLQLAAITLAVCAALAVVLSFFTDNPLVSFVIYAIAFLLFLRFAQRYFYTKLLNILYDECDAQKFHEVITHMPLPVGILLKVFSEQHTGNYGKAIAMMTAHFDASKKLKEKCGSLVYLGRIYFRLRDREKLAEIIEKFNFLKNSNPKKHRVFAAYRTFDYYQDYLNGEYERCISSSEQSLRSLPVRYANSRFLKAQHLFSIAVMCYESGNTERAREIFSEIIETAPKLIDLKAHSEDYLNAIETGNSDILAPITVKWNFVSYYRHFKKVQRKTFLILAMLLSAAIYSAVSFSAYKIHETIEKFTAESDSQASEEESSEEEQPEYVRKELMDELNFTLREFYDKANVINAFTLKKGDEYVGTLCLVDTEVGVDLTIVVYYNGEKINRHIPFAYHINTTPYTYANLPASEYYIGFQNTTSPPKGDCYRVIEYTYNNTTYWLGIDYIEEYLNESSD